MFAHLPDDRNNSSEKCISVDRMLNPSLLIASVLEIQYTSDRFFRCAHVLPRSFARSNENLREASLWAVGSRRATAAAVKGSEVFGGGVPVVCYEESEAKSIRDVRKIVVVP